MILSDPLDIIQFLAFLNNYVHNNIGMTLARHCLLQETLDMASQVYYDAPDRNIEQIPIYYFSNLQTLLSSNDLSRVSIPVHPYVSLHDIAGYVKIGKENHTLILTKKISQENIIQSKQAEENRALTELLYHSAMSSNNIVTSKTQQFMNALKNVMTKIENQDLIVSLFICSPLDYPIIMKELEITAALTGELIDGLTAVQPYDNDGNYLSMRKGIILGGELFTCIHCRRGLLFAIPEREYLGVIPSQNMMRLENQIPGLNEYMGRGMGIIEPNHVAAVQFDY